MTLEQFCAMLPVETQRWVYHHWVASLEEVTQKVEDFMGVEADCQDPWGSWKPSGLRKPSLWGRQVGPLRRALARVLPPFLPETPARGRACE